MNEYEVKRVIEFINRTRELYAGQVPMAEPDAHWNIISHVMLKALAGQAITISALVQVAGVPYGTASRHIHRLIDGGLLRRQPLKVDGKASRLIPSPVLFEKFESYAQSIKVEMARIFGEPKFAAEYDYFFGGEHQSFTLTDAHLFSLKTIPDVDKLRFLVHQDFFFMSIRHIWSDFRRMIGPSRNFQLADMGELYNRLWENATASESQFDIVAVNIAWLGEFASHGLLHPLDALSATPGGSVATDAPDEEDSWMGGQWQGREYGRPIYGAIELLAIRRDWFEEAGIKPPQRFADVIAAGRTFHAPKRGQYGIGWNGRRGIPVARTFMVLLGACCAPIFSPLHLSLPTAARDLDAEHFCNLLHTDAAVEALDYMCQMVAVSPPDVLESGSEQTLRLLMDGRVAMSYIWSMHAMRFEIDIRSAVKRRVSYLAQPAGSRRRGLTPLDGFLLAVPANLPLDRARLAYRVLSWLSSPDAIRGRTRGGMPISPLFSVTRDPEVAALSPIYTLIEKMRQKNLLHFWRRPPLPEYARFEQVLGEEIHDALSGLKSHVIALSSAATRIKSLQAYETM